MGSSSRLVSCYHWVVLMLCFTSIHKALGNDDGEFHPLTAMASLGGLPWGGHRPLSTPRGRRQVSWPNMPSCCNACHPRSYLPIRSKPWNGRKWGGNCDFFGTSKSGWGIQFWKRFAPMICEVFCYLVVSTDLENISVKLHNFPR